MILDEVQLSSGDRVLDIACGTGIVARVARERFGDAGSIVGIDVSPDRLAVARAVAPSIDWREGNASALPLHDGEQFDVVVCQQGLQFVADKPAAAAQMRRALAEGGRLAVATWRCDDEMPFFREIRRVMGDQERRDVAEAIATESVPVLRTYAEGAGIALELSTNLATARG
jgi:ubiquinone/menaquinone biosynthesis C-methylase UbiE